MKLVHGHRFPDGGARAPRGGHRQLLGEVAAFAALALILLVALLIVLPLD